MKQDIKKLTDEDFRLLRRLVENQIAVENKGMVMEVLIPLKEKLENILKQPPVGMPEDYDYFG